MCTCSQQQNATQEVMHDRYSIWIREIKEKNKNFLLIIKSRQPQALSSSHLFVLTEKIYMYVHRAENEEGKEEKIVPWILHLIAAPRSWLICIESWLYSLVSSLKSQLKVFHIFSLAPQQMMTIISLSSHSTSRRTCRNAAANYNNNLQEHSNVDRSCSFMDEAMRANRERMRRWWWNIGR